MSILLSLRKYFRDVGTINTHLKSNRASYVVSKPSDLLKIIIPHFQSYPLITQKRKDFLLWSRTVEMMNKKEHLTKQGLDLIIKMKAFINRGVSKKFQELSSLEKLKDLFTVFQ